MERFTHSSRSTKEAAPSTPAKKFDISIFQNHPSVDAKVLAELAKLSPERQQEYGEALVRELENDPGAVFNSITDITLEIVPEPLERQPAAVPDLSGLSPEARREYQQNRAETVLTRVAKGVVINKDDRTQITIRCS